MKIVVWPLLLLMPVMAAAQTGNYVIEGKIGSLSAPARIYLIYPEGDANRIDSAILKNGSFLFKGTIDAPVKGTLVLDHEGKTGPKGRYADALPLYIEKAKLKVNSPDSLINAKIVGSALNEYNQKLQTALKPLVTQRDSFYIRMNKVGPAEKSSPDFQAKMEAFKESFTKRRKAILAAFIRKNPETIVSLDALQMYSGSLPSLDEVKPLYQALSEAVRNSAPGKAYAARLEKLSKTAVGNLAPDFTQNDTLDRPVSLSSFKGKYVLLDFWASWCVPCREENPALVKLFHLFKDRNFTILSVSLDQKGGKKRWLKAIHDDQLTWTHVSDLGSWQNAVAKLYEINQLPQNFLIDPQGRIIAKNLKVDELKKHLNQLVDVPATDSLALLRNAIEMYPDSLPLHSEFIKLAQRENADLDRQYNLWMEKFPRSATVPYAIAMSYSKVENPKAHSYLLRTVSLDSSIARAWLMLAVEAERSADKVAAEEYLRRAAIAEPGDPAYEFYYAMSFEHTDPVRWRTMLYDLVKKFPSHERGAQGLYWLAARSTDPVEKVKVYEQLRTLYPPQKFGWSEGGMSALYDIYLQTEPSKALMLAQSMKTEQGWAERETVAKNTIAVRALLKDGKNNEALGLLDKLNLPPYSRAFTMIALLKAEVNHLSGKTQAAYDSLLTLIAKAPHDNTRLALGKYGSKLGKDSVQIESDIWKVRGLTTRPAPPFKLGLYTSDSMATLNDYRGKVVLLTFWFPGCGPCRGEFPHFQAVINKFSGKEVAYLGINVFPEQDQYVLPFMEGTKYTFIPLKGTVAWAKEAYNVRGQPTNFLIDKRGNIVFSNFRTDANNHRELELMISSLLNKPE